MKRKTRDDGRGGFEEPVQSGLEELIQIAEDSGPPNVPEDVGNFPAESTPTGNRAPVQRTREPQRLQTAEDEMLERQVRGEQVGKRSERAAQRPEDDEPLEALEDEREERDPPRARAEVVAERHLEDDDEVLEEEPVAEEDEQDDQDGLRHLPPAMRAELQRRDQEIARLQGMVQAVLAGGRPAQPEPAKPAEELTIDNILPYKLGRDFITAIRSGDEEQAANVMQAAIATAVWHAGQKYGERLQTVLEARNPERIIQAREAVAQGKAQLERAFYSAHKDIDPEQHGELVGLLSGQVKQRLVAERGERGFTPKEWIDETAREVRRIAGIRRTTRPAARAQRPERVDERRGQVVRMRPAFSETSSGGGRGAARKPITNEQKDILDLVRFG